VRTAQKTSVVDKTVGLPSNATPTAALGFFLAMCRPLGPKRMIQAAHGWLVALALLTWTPWCQAQDRPAKGIDALSAARLLAVRLAQAEFTRAGSGAAASNGIVAAAKGDAPGIRGSRDELDIDDPGRVAMGALQVLTDPEQGMIEPYTRLKYNFSVDRQSHALMPTPDSRPTTRLMAKLRLELQFQPNAAVLTGHAIHYGLALQLLSQAAANNGSVVLADDVLFSRGNNPNSDGYLQPSFSAVSAPWTLLSVNPAVSGKYSRLPYVVFLQTLINKTKRSPLFCSGIWQDLLPYAEELSPDSRRAWIPVYLAVAEDFETRRRYASGAFIRIFAAGQRPDDCYAVLIKALKSASETDKTANRAVAIAYGYLLEAQIHFGKDVSADRPQHLEITKLLTARLDKREMESVLATRSAPKGGED
jgi:hypothetical protein